jgi:hypothetical protein
MTRTILLFASLAWCTSAAEIAPFFEQHCVKCHGAEKQKGKLRLDTLTWKPADLANLEIWQHVADRLDLGEMPPEEEPQPNDAEVEAMLGTVRERISAAFAGGKSHQVVLRRLNRVQFRNTLRDLIRLWCWSLAS